MKKKLITLDDELIPLLDKYPNQSEIIRQSIRLYIGNISTDENTLEGLKTGYARIITKLIDMDRKLDFIARQIQDLTLQK